MATRKTVTGKTAAGKAATAAASKTVAQPKAAEAIAKPKLKLVRDSFTIPKSEYLVLDDLKQRAARLMRPTKKSELLRAGIAALNGLSDKAFLKAVEAVPSLKTGRPGAEKPADPVPAAKKA